MESDVLQRILDGREKPTNLPLALLKNITVNFSKEREIGHGGFATVYKGVLSNGNVAVKRIRNNHTIDERLFYREVDSLMAINHQNVVRFVGFCASTDQTAIKIEGSREHIYAEIRERLLCFEYISNGSLQKYITDELRGLDWSTRYRLIKGICDGLHYLHMEKHIYHMDLKPANILLDNEMVPKITDFGLSRLDEKSQTMSVDRCGSLGYCAPEYLQRGKMSFKSDIYSLGIIIIELVTGEKSIPDNNKNNVLRRWSHRWKKTGNESPLCYQQVTKCIDIGLLCQEIDPCKRPFISEIINDIGKMECTTGEISISANESTFGPINSCLEDDMLGIEPLELHFPFEINTQMSCSLQLTNETNSYIAFNIQKTRPLPYCTHPHTDIVPPRSKCGVNITLQPQDKAPRDMQHANEFIVRSTRVNDGIAVEDITKEMFNKETNNAVDEVNLDVVFDAQLQSELLDVLNSVQQRGSSQAAETNIITSEEDVLSVLLEEHDLFASSTRSRLTKLQILHQMWQRNDIRGVFAAMEKMSDHAVSADMASVLMEKSETITLDLCTTVLPVLADLLESKTDRHVAVSLELVVKLVRTFGPVIHSTVSATPSSVGVDLQAEQRRERCNLCFIELEKVKNKLPFLTRRKGAAANTAQELSLVFQEVMS